MSLIPRPNYHNPELPTHPSGKPTRCHQRHNSRGKTEQERVNATKIEKKIIAKTGNDKQDDREETSAASNK